MFEQPTIFAVTKDDLKRLNPEEAVDVFRELLWAEATTLGIGKNLINVPSSITVKDGGVDAEVQNAPISGTQGIIKPGITRYQIKTGDFSLGDDNNVRNILFKPKSLELNTRIKTCLDQDGTLAVVLFGWDNPDLEDNQAIDKFREKLVDIDKKYANAKIEVWRQNQIVGFLKPYPSLALRVNGRERARFQAHRSWSAQDDMRLPLQIGTGQQNFIARMQTALREDNDAVHVRVLGEAGIGKTRLVLEATRGDDLQPLVIYCSAASTFRDSDLMNEILKEDNQFRAVIVVDECDQDGQSYIWNKFKHSGSRIKIVSIYNEPDDTTGNITYLDTPPLDAEQISGIIQEYGVTKDQADRWSNICSGSPRVAHVIGRNLKNNPEDLLRPPDTVNIWERYIAGSDDPHNQYVQQRRIVLRHIALFKRFGLGLPVISEAKVIAKIVERADPQITWPRFQEIIKQLKARRILQGENTLYITPKALHIRLWTDWWDTYRDAFNLEEFTEGFPAALLEWFYEMFAYAAESEMTSRIVKELLGTDGPFQANDYLRTRLGARFFLALAEADPASALKCLKKTIGTWNKDDLLQFSTGRRETIWALQKIAVNRDLFTDAARLLLVLGETENETWSNNASGVFAGLFSPATGMFAPTGASPQERFPILQDALTSSSKERRLLALRAFDQALESQFFSRTINHPQGLRKEPDRWMPKTWGELFDAYRQVWQLLITQLRSYPKMKENRQSIFFWIRQEGC